MSTLSPHLGYPVAARGRSLRQWLAQRNVRVLMLLPIIWGLNLLDLFFTRLAYLMRDFTELNPLASHLGGIGQTLLKVGVLTFVSVVFVCLRRRRCVEMGCYLLLFVYGALAVVWLTTFPFLLYPCYLGRFWSGF